MLRIPKEFKAGGRTIKVKFVPALHEKTGDLGHALLDTNEILLQPPKTGVTSADTVEQTFYHELVHFLFHFIGENKLCDDHRVVDPLSQYLYQYEVTRRGSLKA